MNNNGRLTNAQFLSGVVTTLIVVGLSSTTYLKAGDGDQGSDKPLLVVQTTAPNADERQAQLAEASPAPETPTAPIQGGMQAGEEAEAPLLPAARGVGKSSDGTAFNSSYTTPEGQLERLSQRLLELKQKFDQRSEELKVAKADLEQHQKNRPDQEDSLGLEIYEAEVDTKEEEVNHLKTSTNRLKTSLTREAEMLMKLTKRLKKDQAALEQTCNNIDRWVGLVVEKSVMTSE